MTALDAAAFVDTLGEFVRVDFPEYPGTGSVLLNEDETDNLITQLLAGRQRMRDEGKWAG